MEDWEDYFQYIEWDSDDQMWSQVDVNDYMEQECEIEKQRAQEQQTFPRLQKIKTRKTPPVNRSPETPPWTFQRENEFITYLSNTKYVRDCHVAAQLPDSSYVIIPIQEYTAFRRGSKDDRWGSRAIILSNPLQCDASIKELGEGLHAVFGT